MCRCEHSLSEVVLNFVSFIVCATPKNNWCDFNATMKLIDNKRRWGNFPNCVSMVGALNPEMKSKHRARVALTSIASLHQWKDASAFPLAASTRRLIACLSPSCAFSGSQRPFYGAVLGSTPWRHSGKFHGSLTAIFSGKLTRTKKFTIGRLMCDELWSMAACDDWWPFAEKVVIFRWTSFAILKTFIPSRNSRILTL